MGILTTKPSSTSLGFHQAQDLQFSFPQFDQVIIRQCPEAVTFETEVFQPQTGLVFVGHHEGAPVLKILDSANFNIRIMNVDPVIGKDFAFVDNEGDGEKISVFEITCSTKHGFWHWRLEPFDDLSNRHTADKIGAVD